jgi:radical SAM protein with 4Fe4S-binding SPASM domain
MARFYFIRHGDAYDENGLQLDELLKKLNLPATARITTNGVCDLNLSLLSKMTQITVSIDGNQIQHNTQRKSLLHDDPYEKTIANLKIMLKNFGKNVYVQAAVRDEFFTTDYKKSFYKTMLKLGVYKDNIIYGCIHPTKKKPDPQQMYLQSLKMVKLRDNPCCKFRYMRNFVIDSSNSVFGEFFNASQENRLGSLDDDLETIQQRYKELILNTMPALKDEKCMSCPVLGFCWGGCISGNSFVHDQPSKYCNQEGLIAEVKKVYDY